MFLDEIAGSCAPQGIEKRSASKLLPDVVRDAADVGSGRTVDAKTRGLAVEFFEIHLDDADFHGCQFDRNVFTRKLIRRRAGDFLSRKRRRSLQERSPEWNQRRLQFLARKTGRQGFGNRGTLPVIGVGGESETDARVVGLFGWPEKLSEARSAADEKRKNSGGHGIERAEVADFASAGQSAQPVHDIVRCHAGRLIDDDCSIHDQNSIAESTSDGLLSKALQMASRLSMLGRFAPRSMELICEMLSLVAAARSFNDQSRSTRSILI